MKTEDTDKGAPPPESTRLRVLWIILSVLAIGFGATLLIDLINRAVLGQLLMSAGVSLSFLTAYLLAVPQSIMYQQSWSQRVVNILSVILIIAGICGIVGIGLTGIGLGPSFEVSNISRLDLWLTGSLLAFVLAIALRKKANRAKNRKDKHGPFI